MEFVQSSSAEEELLLILLQRIERLETLVEKTMCKIEKDLDPLVWLDPRQCPSRLEEAREIAHKLSKSEFPAIHGNLTYNCQPCCIRFEENITQLRRRGFIVDRVFNDSLLPKDYYNVRWISPSVCAD